MPHYENVPFEVPDNWVWMTLGEVGTWQSGGTPSRSNKTYIMTGLFMMISNIFPKKFIRR